MSERRNHRPEDRGKLAIGSNPSEVWKAARHIESWIERHASRGEKWYPLLAAVREAMDNALEHGNRFDTEKKIEVSYACGPDGFEFVIADEGGGFDFHGFLSRIRKMSVIEAAEARRTEGGFGGLGVLIMIRCADRLEYIGCGNRVRLYKHRQPPS